MGRIRRHTPEQGIRSLGTERQQEGITRLCAEKGQRQIQGFRTRQGAQPHGKQARKHMEEAARGSRDKGRPDAARRKEACTGGTVPGTRNGTGSAIHGLPSRHHPVPYRHRRGKPAPLHPRKGHGGVRRRVRLPRGGEPQGADKPRRVLVHRDDVRTIC